MVGLTLPNSRRAGAVLVLVLAFSKAFGQTVEAKPAPPGLHPAEDYAHQVVVNNRLITVMRAPFLGYSPTDRAAGAERRLREILAREGPGKVTVKDSPESRGFSVDGVFAFFVTPGDADAAFGETFDEATLAAHENLERVLRERAEVRDPQALAISIGFAAIATFVFVVIVRAIAAIKKRLRQRVSSLLAERARGVKIAGVHAIDLGLFLRGARFLISSISWLLMLLATYAWLVFVLDRFPYTRPWGENLLHFLVQSVGDFFGAITGSIPGLITVAVIFVVARWMTQLLSAFFSRVEHGRVTMSWLDSDTAGPTRRIVNVVVWLFALAMAYPYLPGAQTDAFKGLSVLVGLMISIGASNLVGQAASGLILMYARSFRPGEFVRIGDAEGSVTELGLFSTRVRTGLGEEVLLPNSHVLSQTTTNYSRNTPAGGYIVDCGVSIGYATPWRQVHAMLAEAARRTHGVLEDPPPQVIQSALSDFYVGYRIVCHVDAKRVPQRQEVLSELHANIQDVFNEHDVQIMSPHYMLDPHEAQVVPRSKWFAPPAVAPSEDGTAG